MLNHKKIMEDSAAFFNQEVDKVIYKVVNAKNDKERTKYLKQLMALKNRLSLEVKMIDELGNF
jgi:CII-binding regulator of phage lambda lysogenization HflD